MNIHKRILIVSKILLCLLFVTALLFATGESARGDSIMPKNKVPGTVESKAHRLMHDLKEQGFEVSRGYFKLYTNDDCPTSYQVLGSCLGNNPAAPYVLPLVPPWPDEWADPALIGAVGPTANGYGGTFRFAPREAIVILGVMPPHASYFGLQTYLFTRQGIYSKTSDQYKFIKEKVPYLLPVFFATVPNNDERIELFASLSNSNNNVVIGRQSGVAWDQVRYFVITPDRSMDAAVRSTLSRIGIAATDIFTEPIPGNLHLGLGESADDFLMLMRYAMPEDGGETGTPSDRWRNELPLVVMRVRDARSGAQPQPYPEVSLETRTAVNEAQIPQLQTDLGLIVQGVKAKWQQPLADIKTSFNLQSQLLMVGPECMPIGMNCLGDAQDTIYQMSQRFPLDGNPQQVYAVVGTLGIATGNATYVGLGLNNSLYQLGIDDVSDSELLGSAHSYDPNVSDPGKFFVYYFTRDCTGLEELTGNYCLSVPKTKLPECRDPADPNCQLLVFSLRGYIRPSTQRGPDAAQTVSQVVITLHRP